MEIIKFVNGLLKENCYVVHNSNSCIIVDPGKAYKEVVGLINEKKLKPLAVLLTHGHFDHIWDCHLFQSDGIKVYINKYDADKCEDNTKNLSGVKSKLNTFKAGI